MPVKTKNNSSGGRQQQPRGTGGNVKKSEEKVESPKKKIPDKKETNPKVKSIEDKSLEDMLVGDGEDEDGASAAPVLNSESNDEIQASQIEHSVSQMAPQNSNVISDRFEELFQRHLEKQYTPANKHEEQAQKYANESVRALLPMMGEFFYGVLTKAITDSVKIVNDVNTEMVSIKKDVEKVAAQADQAENSAMSALVKADRMDQRDRGKNIRIVGLPEKPNEVTSKEVIDFAKSLDVTYTGDDIEEVYRVERKLSANAGTQATSDNQAPKPRPIFIRFKSKELRKKLYDAKKLIPNKHPGSRIFICDDLTPARAKMLQMARSVPDKTAFSNGIDGSILVYPKRQQGTASNTRVAPIVLREPKDVLNLPNMSSDDVESVYEVMERT